MLEALACGTPIIASDIDALREVGGAAVEYCPAEDIEVWASAVARMLAERRDDPAGWRARRTAGIERAATFSWSHYTAEVVALYLRLAAGVPQGASVR